MRRLTEFVGSVTSNNRREWLVVASVLMLLALAVGLGWIQVDLPWGR